MRTSFRQRIRFGGKYVGGFWRGETVDLFNVILRRNRLTRTDLVSLGCTLVPRRFLVSDDGEPHTFNPGIDQFVTSGGALCHIADSGAFSLHVSALSGRMFLDAAVVAEHLSEGKPIAY
jgi:hypothetical protein